jgi:uncharacterized membrane protein YeaQ/YmgE (transglycosylase-associated protein family)
MGWLFWMVITGLIVGALGRLVLPGRQNIGIPGTIAAGILGSIIGAVIAWLVPFFDHKELSGLVFNVAGAALTLVAWERVNVRSGRPRRAA